MKNKVFLVILLHVTLGHSGVQAFNLKGVLWAATPVLLATAAQAAQTYYCATYEGTVVDGTGVLNCRTPLTEVDGYTHCVTYRLIENAANHVVMTCVQVSGLDYTCFKSDMVAYRQEGSRYRKVSLAQLQEGDTVLDAQGNPTQVIGFLDRQNGVEAKTMRFYGQRENEEVLLLEVTPSHLLFDSKQKAHLAQDFKVGDAFLGAHQKPVAITRIEGAMASSVIAPLTASGTLLVGAGSTSVGASCYAHVSSHQLAHTYYQAKRGICRLLGVNPTSDGRVSRGETLVLQCLQQIGLAKP